MTSEFDKSSHSWSYKKTGRIPLDSCYRSPMSCNSVAALQAFATAEARLGSEIGCDSEFNNGKIQGGLRSGLGQLLNVKENEISLHGSTQDAIRKIAQQFPFAAGDKVLAYKGDYPSVYVPFAERTEVELRFLEGSQNEFGCASQFSFEELEKAIIEHAPRFVSISHIQYRSGFKLDLQRLADLCKARNIFLFVDIAQSIGVIPIDLKALGVAGAAFPLWKGLNGPRGVAALWLSEDLGRILRQNSRLPDEVAAQVCFTGMTSQDCEDARIFEPSTLPTALIAQAREALNSGVLQYDAEALQSEVLRLQRLLLAKLNPRFVRAVLPEEKRGGLIVSVYLPKHRGKEDQIVKEASSRGLIVTNRGGMLRFAPHYYTSDHEIEAAAFILNNLLAKHFESRSENGYLKTEASLAQSISGILIPSGAETLGVEI